MVFLARGSHTDAISPSLLDSGDEGGNGMAD